MTTWKSRLVVSRNANDESEVDDSLLNGDTCTGEDQQQHLELTRDLAETFNRAYPSPTPLFQLPELMLTPSKRILSLRDPTAKISKSAIDPNSRILLTDSITFDPVERPGTSNLLRILSACTGEAPAVLAEGYAGSNHGTLKKDVVEVVEEALRRPRAEFARLRDEKTFLAQVARDGAEKAREHSDRTLKEVRKRVGLS